MINFKDDLSAALNGPAIATTSSRKWDAVASAFSALIGVETERIRVKGRKKRSTWNIVTEVLGMQFNAKRKLELLIVVFDDRKDKRTFLESVDSELRIIEDWVARGAFKAVLFLHVTASGHPRLTHLVQSGTTDLRAELLAVAPQMEVVTPVPAAAYPEDDAETHEDDAPAPESLEQLADALNLPIAWLEEVIELLTDSKAMVLYGPPGTGKSFIAQAIAKFVQPRGDLRRLVQLHPSFGYESFFEGYRPSAGTSGMTLKKVQGPLRRLSSALVNEPDEDGFLILDEMNRGNLPKVFGELYFLLEYRNATVELMYSEAGDAFGLPSRLNLIGTMNTADRSVSVLDQALRRRFSFVPLYPDEPPLAKGPRHPGVLRRHLEGQPDFAWVADVLDRLNQKLVLQLSDRDVMVGPSHFLKGHLTNALVERRWKYFILPSVQAALGSEDPADVAAFTLETLRNEISEGLA